MPVSPTIPVAADLALKEPAASVEESASTQAEAPAGKPEGARPRSGRKRRGKAAAAAEQAQSAAEPVAAQAESAAEPLTTPGVSLPAKGPSAYTFLPVQTAPVGYELSGVEPETEAEGAEEEAPVRKAKPKRRKSTIVVLLLAVLLLVGAAVMGGIAWYQGGHRGFTAVDMDGNRVAPDDPSLNDPAFVQAADAKPDLGLRFKIPSVSLDVALGSVNQVDGTLNPPGFTSAFLVKNLGVGTSLANADKGTVYVVTHSLRAPGRAPGNYVTDSSGAIVVKNGAEIDVGDRVYSVVSSESVLKENLGLQTNLWANTPNMLVFVTCLESGSATFNAGHSDTNVVIIGQLVS